MSTDFWLTFRHAKQKAQQGELAEAAAVLAEHSASSDPTHYELYKHIVGGVLGLSHAHSSKQGELSCLEFLWQLVRPFMHAAQDSIHPAKVSNVVLCSASDWTALPHTSESENVQLRWLELLCALM